jgi:NADPH:quinone reductase-like Zn-dependent oxidoreductase
MKAIRVREFGGPEVLKLEEVVTPKPSAGEVLVRIRGTRKRAVLSEGPLGPVRPP